MFEIPKPKQEEDLFREEKVIEPFKRIMIVTEGTKTENSYLEKLRNELKATTANVIIYPESNSSPNQVWKYAKAKLDEDPDFDFVYIVIDRDRHTTYSSTLQSISDVEQSKKYGKTKFKKITSVPCFEFWFLLHFGFTTKPYSQTRAGSSPADQLIKDLKTKEGFSNYDKSKCNYFNILNGKIEDAIKNSKRVLREAKKTGDQEFHENPSTRVHILVEDIKKLVVKKLK